MVTSTTLKRDTTPFIQPSSKHLDPTFPHLQILENLRVTNMNLSSIILMCSQTKKRVINTEQNSKKTKYVPITENVIARIYPKESCKDLMDLGGTIKSGRKVELIRFNISETKEVTEIKRNRNDYLLLKANEFLKDAEDAMSRELYFLEKYKNQPGILPIIARYSYTSKSSRKNIDSAPKKAMITQRIQDVFTLIANPESYPKLLSSIQQFDFFKKEAKKQLLEAVLAIHNQGDIHRDIKLENTLWEKVDDSLRFYLIDFDSSLNCSELDKIKNFAGTCRYWDPQILAGVLAEHECRDDEAKQQEIRNKATSQKNDIFSLGLVFYLLRESTHLLPDSIQGLMDEQEIFPHNGITLENISSIAFFRSQSQDQRLFKDGSFEHLVWRMLRPNQRERITAQEAFEELTRINNESNEAHRVL